MFSLQDIRNVRAHDRERPPSTPRVLR
jgi:hypothetical protein